MNRKHDAAVKAAKPHYDALLAAQDGKCGICGREPKEGQRRFHIDTDHRREYAVRGLLCYQCNRPLRINVTISWLCRAIEYLARYEVRRIRGQ